MSRSTAKRRHQSPIRFQLAANPRVEQLEFRNLLSGWSQTTWALMEAQALPSDLVALPALGAAPQASSGVGGLTAAQVRHAYGFDRIVLGNRFAGDGAGQTIAIITAYDHPTIAQDLSTFCRQMGLPDPPAFTKVTPQGVGPVDPLWALETALDVEWAHAMAPQANLLLVEAKSANLGDMLAAVNYARQLPGVSVVSMSWGSPEFSVQTFFDATLTTPAGHLGGNGKAGGITFVAASGDSGASQGPLWPASSPNVVSVGGTQLVADQYGNYVWEIGWSGSGGGFSQYETAPAFQKAYTGSTRRSTPDVAFNASEASTFAVYTTVPWNGQSGWLRVAGTSAGTPQWAGLVAIINQGRALAGLGSSDNTLASLYSLPASAFHDVVQGNNGYAAGPGYDLVTGRGSPFADGIVSQLVPKASTTSRTQLNFDLISRSITNFFRRTTGQTSTSSSGSALVGGTDAVLRLRLPSGSSISLEKASLSALEQCSQWEWGEASRPSLAQTSNLLRVASLPLPSSFKSSARVGEQFSEARDRVSEFSGLNKGRSTSRSFQIEIQPLAGFFSFDFSAQEQE